MSNTLYVAKQYLLILLKARGYDIGDEEKYLNMKLNEFKREINSELEDNPKETIHTLFSGNYRSPNGNTCLVKFASKGSGSQVGKGSIEDFLIDLNDYGINDEAIIVADANLSVNANALVKNVKNVYLQVFKEEELTYNPNDRVDVPKHQKLTEEEASEVLLELGVQRFQLDQATTEDAIIKYYGWRPGSIIMIERVEKYLNVMVPKTIAYRVVI